MIDDYHQPDVILTKDGSIRAAHGRVVEQVIKNFLPGAEVIRFPRVPAASPQLEFSFTDKAGRRLPQGKQPYGDDLPALRALFERVKAGEHFDAVNCSYGSEATFDSFAKHYGLPLNRENVAEFASQIRHSDKLPPSLKEEFEILSELKARGVKIYVSGGNYGRNHLIYPLILNDVIGVGALDQTGKKAMYSGDNARISRWALGNYPIKPIEKDGKLVGFSMLGDETLDIPIADTYYVPQQRRTESGDGKVEGKVIWGTSGSAPKALAEDLQNS